MALSKVLSFILHGLSLGTSIAIISVIWSTLWDIPSWNYIMWPIGRRYYAYDYSQQCLMAPVDTGQVLKRPCIGGPTGRTLYNGRSAVLTLHFLIIAFSDS